MAHQYPMPSALPQALIHSQEMEVDTITAPGMESKSSVRSCTTCSKAKAKCVRRPGEQICERCARLRKECHSREPVLRRRKVSKTTRAAQLEKLENKIEHLVNALATTHAQRGFSIDHGQPSPPTSNASSDRATSTNRTMQIFNQVCPENINATPPSESFNSDCATAQENTNNQLTPPAAPTADQDPLAISLPEAEILLDRYKRLMSIGMPFVPLPNGTNAKHLRTHKPVLLQAITVVAYFYDLPRQRDLVKQLMRNLSERILMNNEKSIDILQAILVFVAWYHPHLFQAQQITNLMHLAIAMTIDLGLNRPPQQCGDFKSTTNKAIHGVNCNDLKVASLEEHRILAGCFYLTSMIATSFKKIDAMPWTSYLENGLRIIEQRAEYESDGFLVQMTRVQHLMEELTSNETPSAPVQMYIKTFKFDLERLQENSSCNDPDNVLLRMQHLISEVMIWELSLIDLQEQQTKPLRSHLDDLYSLVKSIKAFIDEYFTLPDSQYLTVPFSYYAQFAHAFIVLIKLASLEVEGWDMKAINDELNFTEFLDSCAARFEHAQLATPDGLKVNNDSFNKWGARVRWMKTMFESKFVPEAEKGEDRSENLRTPGGPPTTEYTEATPASGVQQPTPPDDVLSGDFFNYLDENFWQSFAGDFDLGYPDVTMT